MSEKPLVVGIGGTPRTGSSSEKALQFALAHAEILGCRTLMFAGRDLMLPIYDLDIRDNSQAKAMTDALREADGVIVSSPCYHGAISGLVKNALDYIEDLREAPRAYLDGRAVGCISCGAGHQGPNMVISQIRMITHALRGWPTPLGVSINTQLVRFDGQGCSEPAIEAQLRLMAEQVVRFAKARV